MNCPNCGHPVDLHKNGHGECGAWIDEPNRGGDLCDCPTIQPADAGRAER